MCRQPLRDARHPCDRCAAIVECTARAALDSAANSCDCTRPVCEGTALAPSQCVTLHEGRGHLQALLVVCRGLRLSVAQRRTLKSIKLSCRRIHHRRSSRCCGTRSSCGCVRRSTSRSRSSQRPSRCRWLNGPDTPVHISHCTLPYIGRWTQLHVDSRSSRSLVRSQIITIRSPLAAVW